MSWRYRVFKSIPPLGDSALYSVQEVYDHSKDLVGYADPQPAYGETLQELKEDLLRQLEAVRRVEAGEEKLMQETNAMAKEIE